MEFLKLIFKFNWYGYVSRLRGNLFGYGYGKVNWMIVLIFWF